MKRTALFSVFALIVLWAGWTIAYFVIGNEYILPAFSQTIAATGAYLVSGTFYNAFFNTLARTVIAFVCSAAAGTVLALVSYRAAWARAFFAPVVSVLRTVPTMAIILALLIWTSPAAAPVVVCVLVLFPAWYAAALAGFDEVGREYGDVARVYKVPLSRRIFRMYLPLAAPVFLGQAGSLLSMGLKITVSAEVLAKTYRSLGGMMQEAQAFVEMPELLALTLVTIVLGFALEGLCAVIAHFAVRWKR